MSETKKKQRREIRAVPVGMGANMYLPGMGAEENVSQEKCLSWENKNTRKKDSMMATTIHRKTAERGKESGVKTLLFGRANS